MERAQGLALKAPGAAIEIHPGLIGRALADHGFPGAALLDGARLAVDAAIWDDQCSLHEAWLEPILLSCERGCGSYDDEEPEGNVPLYDPSLLPHQIILPHRRPVLGLNCPFGRLSSAFSAPGPSQPGEARHRAAMRPGGRSGGEGTEDGHHRHEAAHERRVAPTCLARLPRGLPGRSRVTSPTHGPPWRSSAMILHNGGLREGDERHPRGPC
jgi:hypothetical protein